MWSKPKSKSKPKEIAKETTPLLGSTATQNWTKLRNVTKAGISFRRIARSRSSPRDRGPGASVRGSIAFPFFVPANDDTTTGDEEDGSYRSSTASKNLIEPSEALLPLTNRGRHASLVKSIPAFPPYRRMARHRSFHLVWTNEFRHWWKSSRLLVRLGGLDTFARDPDVWDKMIHITPLHFKSLKKMYKLVKRLGQGGPMRYFLSRVHPFTRGVRILVAIWRWIESAPCRRLEVGVEETMAFVGNRVSRMLARLFVDSFVTMGIIPSSHYLWKRQNLSLDLWFPAVCCIIMGIIRAVSPYVASFQGSRVGRVLTRSFFKNSYHRWLPIQRIGHLNLKCDDCQEGDEVSENADLARLGKLIAKALGKAQKLGKDGFEGQNDELAKEGFHQVGSGSGGYAVYECHRRVSDEVDDEMHTILLHVTPYGPSLLDVMPRYLVLEKEDSQDTRGDWSQKLASLRWNGPSVLEGYAYQGAFFSPHHFAEMKEMYDKQLLAYDRACKAMARKDSPKAGPPTDLSTLKEFLNIGKLPRKKKKNAREFQIMQKNVGKVARKLKSMMSTGKEGCTAPHGVILYFEGLDCSGKSSTGGLIQQALADVGFEVSMEQYNRPPTDEQKRHEWMWRFARPDTTESRNEIGEDGKMKPVCTGHRHRAVVWDRGPAGDFVYGALTSSPESVKRERHREFMDFDAECFRNNILFIKLMFVTNRDSIATTLGKRLAQRKMVQDLRTWLKASDGGGTSNANIPMEGLDFIDMHIDPTDFIAFNKYQTNLHKFVNFALNTDTEHNPWVVVNTGDRFSARKQLLRIFEAQLNAYASAKRSGSDKCFGLLGPPSVSESLTSNESAGITEAGMIEKKIKKGLSMATIFAMTGILLLLFYYCEHVQFFTNVTAFFEGLYGPSDSTDVDNDPDLQVNG